MALGDFTTATNHVLHNFLPELDFQVLRPCCWYTNSLRRLLFSRGSFPREITSDPQAGQAWGCLRYQQKGGKGGKGRGSGRGGTFHFHS